MQCWNAGGAKANWKQQTSCTLRKNFKKYVYTFQNLTKTGGKIHS